MIKRFLIAVAVLAVLLEIRKKYFKGFWAYLRSYSFCEDRLLLILLPLLTFVLLWADLFLRHQVQTIDGGMMKSMITWGGLVAKNLWTSLIMIYLLAWLARQDEWQDIFFTAFLAGASTGLTIGIFKFTLLRARPDSGLGPFSFFHLEGLTQDNGMFQSFPSGDVAIVAGAAAYFIFCLRNPLHKALVFLVPVGTALSRVLLNDHWPSDTLFSVGSGFMLGRFWWGFKKHRI